MKEFKLAAWPDLPSPYHRTAYRRMLSDMSHRFVSLPATRRASAGCGATRCAQFIEMLDAQAAC